MKRPRKTSDGYCVHCGGDLSGRCHYYSAHTLTCWRCAQASLELRRWACNLVRAAIRRGVLPQITERTPCADCGAPAKFYDHRNYLRPIDVEPVCHGCNIRRGPVDMKFGWAA